jgi:hypothetical protein
MYGLFLTCTQRLLFLCYIQLHEQLISERNPLAVNNKPTYLEDRCLAHGGKFPSSKVPCLKPTALTLTFQASPHPLLPPLARTILQQQHQQCWFLDPEQ